MIFFICAPFINSQVILNKKNYLAFVMNTDMEMCNPNLFCLIIQCITPLAAAQSWLIYFISIEFLKKIEF